MPIPEPGKPIEGVLICSTEGCGGEAVRHATDGTLYCWTCYCNLVMQGLKDEFANEPTPVRQCDAQGGEPCGGCE